MRQKIYEMIISYIEEHGYAPSYREIMETVGLKSLSSVKQHIDNLVKLGALETDHEASPRAIRVPGYRFVKEDEQ